MSQASFAKRQREKERREKAAAKAERRAERSAAPDPEPEPALTPAAEEALLASLAELHARFEANEIEFEEFIEAKEQITERLSVS